MKPENAVFVRDYKIIPSLSDRFQRVYYGEEFCEDLMPSFRQVLNSYKASTGSNLKFTLVTPLSSDNGVKKVMDILYKLSDEHCVFEVVLSDWGILDIVTRTGKNKLSCEPVLGRAITRQKTGPRLILLKDIQPQAVQTGKKVPLGAGSFLEFLKQRGITRLEMDNPLHGIDVQLPLGFRGSVYHPWVFTSLSRISHLKDTICPAKKSCSHPCLKFPATLTHPDMPVPLLNFGKAIFYENPEPVNNSQPGIDRLVYFDPLGRIK